MSFSLVAYDDSDSEAETGRSGDLISSEINLTNSAVDVVQPTDDLNIISETKAESVEYMGSSKKNMSYEDTFQQHLQPNEKTTITAVQQQHNRNCTLTKTRTKYTQPLYTQPLEPKIPSGNTYAQKRMRNDEDVTIQKLRPYVSKKVQQEKKEYQEESASSPVKFSTAEDKMTVKVSQYIMPYVGSKYAVTEIPKNLVFHMAEHSGPVNAVRWCPLQRWSHMLLSASMDKTVKVWDAVDEGRCLKSYFIHTGAVRAIQWSPCGKTALSGGFDFMLHLTDIETGTQLFSSKNEFRISTLTFHPLDPNVFLCGGFSPEVKAWDIRSSKVIKVYKATVQQTLDIMFLHEGKEFFTSTDAVSQDSADRTIIAWDFQTAAKISNQIFHERFTCPSLSVHPKEPAFVAQTNGNYMALFSSLPPYRINKKKRFEGHKVEGFAVGCEFSPDGTLLVTGSSDGKVFFYNYRTAQIIRTMSAHSQACVNAVYHPVLPSLLATCAWDGIIKIWQ
ncbi:PREDICTED: WD repeat-containing protein 25 isoform X1 [Thamnophis sirtalis]|uniref:WD repeat-containing protein 25 isoform X1 n=1 Tax=Thamnophis sirtalis TaxID=35019 RepID=A0A6I9XF67_9SAUR|nr:PREDICTED: WD repeat-containing protein 25 isoform X1 [Thamnophis sirtalis]